MIKKRSFLIVVTLSIIISLSTTCSFAASKPAKVSGVAVSARTSSSITVKWNKAKYAKKYKVGYKISGGKWKYKTVKAKTRSKKFTKLKAYKKYYFKVRALRGSKTGKWSSTISTYTAPTKFSWPELLTIKSLSISHEGPGSIVLAWETEKPSDTRLAVAQTKVDEAQAEVNRIQALIDEGEIAEEEPVEVSKDTITEEIETEDDPIIEERPTLEEQLEAAKQVLTQATTALEAVKTDNANTKTLYDKCTFRIYRSTNNKNWSLWTTVSNGTRSYTVRKCDAGTKYYFKVVPVDTVSYTTFSHEGIASSVVDGTAQGIPGLDKKVEYTTRNYAYLQNLKYTVKGLMLHSVGAAKPSAKEWFNIYNAKGYDMAAVHAFIDGDTGKVWQMLPWTMRGGHAGKIANDQYVGIEMCESSKIKYTSGTKFTISDKTSAKASAVRTYEMSVKLFAYLCDYFGLNPTGTFTAKKDNGKNVTVNVIMSHNEWRLKGHSGHYDPEHYWKGLGLNNDGTHNYTMSKFRNDVAATLAANK